MSREKLRVVVFEDKPSLEEYTAKTWDAACSEARGESGTFRVALSGGVTPGGFYATLSEHKETFPWPSIHVFQADERFVPASDVESNLRLLRQTLLDRVPIPDGNIHFIDTGLKDPEESAWRYEAEIIAHFRLKPGQFPRFDLIMLGLGADGHTASLFPGSEVLCETRRLVRAVRPGRPLRDRVTLTLPVINNARRILFLVLGSAKAEILKESVEVKKASLPAAWIDPVGGEVLFLVDREAAALLSEKTYTRFTPPKPHGSPPNLRSKWHK